MPKSADEIASVIAKTGHAGRHARSTKYIPIVMAPISAGTHWMYLRAFTSSMTKPTKVPDDSGSMKGPNPNHGLSWLAMMSTAAPEMYPTITLRETYCRRSAMRSMDPSTATIPTIATKSGTNSPLLDPRCG